MPNRNLAIPTLITAPEHDETGYRGALSRFATGVSVVTACNAQGVPLGLTVSSFSSVSLKPPLILWSLAKRAALFAEFSQVAYYAVNVLHERQLPLSAQFSQSIADRFAQTPHHPGSTGVPLLEGCIAWFECRNRSQYSEGDHVIFVGEVVCCGYTEGAPLVHHSHGYHLTKRHASIKK